MENDYYVVQKTTCDPDKMSATEGLRVVSFRIEVLDKYKNNPDYIIDIPKSVGTLKSNKQGWSLQIDVHDYHVSTWLYKMGDIPEDEQAHLPNLISIQKNSAKWLIIDGHKGCQSNYLFQG